MAPPGRRAGGWRGGRQGCLGQVCLGQGSGSVYWGHLVPGAKGSPHVHSTLSSQEKFTRHLYVDLGKEGVLLIQLRKISMEVVKRQAQNRNQTDKGKDKLQLLEASERVENATG